MRGVGAKILVTWLTRRAGVEILRRHTATNGPLATKRSWRCHDKDVIRKRKQVLHTIEQGHLNNRQLWLSPRTARARKDGSEALTNSRHLDRLEASRILRRHKRAGSQLASIQLARIPINQVIPKLSRNSVQNGTTRLEHLAGDLIEVAPPGTAIMQQAGNGRLTRRDTAG